MHFYFVSMKNEKSWIPIGDTYQATDDIFVTVRDETGMHYEFHLLPGFRCNMGSVPLVFRWYVPSYDPKNPLLNISYAIHDAMYCSGLMHKDLADQLLYDMLLDAGLCKHRAYLVRYAVGKFGKSHYGVEHDNFESSIFVKLRVYYPETK